MKIITIVGARPQFIKAAAVSRAILEYNLKGGETGIQEVLVHTGQHYDYQMSQVFFDELEIRKPDYHLNVGSGSHGKMTGLMLERIEDVLFKERPDRVLVYGDTNSTLAGALAASKLHIPVAHVEAGLRSFNRQMPEEINRVLTDHVSDLLFCPTDASIVNLQKEGITHGVFKVGDVMYDAFLFYQGMAERRSHILQGQGLESGEYCLATLHREENTDNPGRLTSIFEAFSALADESCPFIIPLHPRTEKALKQLGNHPIAGLHMRLLPPVSYLDMIALESHARLILTDSGGVQKEAYFAGVPCITLREETEWVELVERGYNVIAGFRTINICDAFHRLEEKKMPVTRDLYGSGKSSHGIVHTLISKE